MRLLTVILLFCPSPLLGGTITVSNLSDSGAGSLRTATAISFQLAFTSSGRRRAKATRSDFPSTEHHSVQNLTVTGHPAHNKHGPGTY